MLAKRKINVNVDILPKQKNISKLNENKLKIIE